MKRVRFGRTGLEVSRVGMGGIPIQRPAFDEAVEIVKRAIDLGINFFDTSIAYTDSELRLAKGIEGHREDVVIATKGSWRDRETAEKCIDFSLERFDTDYLDIWQLHNVSTREGFEGLFRQGGAMEAAEEALEEGKIRHLGISIHSLDVALEAVKSDRFEVIQFPYNFVLREAEDELIPLARQHDIGFIGMKPFAGGRLRDANLAIKYVLQQDVVVPDPGVQTIEELEEIVGIVNGDTSLSEDEMRRIGEKRGEVGTKFCRRCGYCMPCPNGVMIPNIMCLPILYNEWPREQIESWEYIKNIIGSVENCVECGVCEEKCPYGLSIREMLAENVANHQRFLESGT